MAAEESRVDAATAEFLRAALPAVPALLLGFVCREGSLLVGPSCMRFLSDMRMWSLYCGDIPARGFPCRPSLPLMLAQICRCSFLALWLA